MLEVQPPTGDKYDIAMRKADFDKLTPNNMQQVLNDARSTRGRLPGTKVNGNGS